MATALATRELVRRLAPPRIDDLWVPSSSWPEATDPALTHFVAEQLFEWADDDENSTRVGDLLENEQRLHKLVVEVADVAFQLGLNAQQLAVPGTLVASCPGCNTPYDSGGCVHDTPGNERALINTRRALGPQNDVIVSQNLHKACTLFALTAHLLSKRKSHKLASLMTPEPSPPMNYGCFASSLAMSGERGFCCVLQLFGLLDNASTAFPKAAMYAAACLSLAVSRRPSQAFALLDPEAMAPAVVKYLNHPFHLVHDSQCIVEQSYGLAAFINVLPLLYCFGDWQNIHQPMLQSSLVGALTTTALNILHSIHQGNEANDVRTDSKFNLDDLPELNAAIIFIDPCIKSNVLREHPMSWAVVAALEVLAKWASRGIPVLTQTVGTRDTGDELISDVLVEFRPQLESICSKVRQLGIQLMSDLIEGTASSSSSFDSTTATAKEYLLSNRMSKLAHHCAYCGKGDSSVSMCTGGCLGLARYCSKDHQKKHWSCHKQFCNIQSR